MEGDIGEELNLLSTILGTSIISFTLATERTHQNKNILTSFEGLLYNSSRYEPYKFVPQETPTFSFDIPILHTGNHFQALVPPLTFNVRSLESFSVN